MKKKSIIILLIGVLILIYGVVSILSDSRYMSDSIEYSLLHQEMICMVSIGFVFLSIGLVWCIFYKTVSKCCTLKTSLLSIGLSASVTMGIYCGLVMLTTFWFDELGEFPFTSPVSQMGCLIAVIIFFILLLFYMKMRRKNPSKLGVAIDVALSFFCIIPFFYAYGILHTYLSEWLATYYDKMG